MAPAVTFSQNSYFAQLTIRGIGSNTDPLVYATVFAALVCVAALACLVPARRAAAIEPAVALSPR